MNPTTAPPAPTPAPNPAPVSAVNAARIARMRRVLFRAGWQHPFLLLPAQKLILRIDDSIPTAAVNSVGVMRISGPFMDGLSDDDLIFVLCHETMHPLMGHFQRRGTRDPKKWNKSGDRAINKFLADAGITTTIPGILLPEDSSHDNYTAEQFYEVEGGDGPDNPAPGQGCGVDPAGPGDSDSGVGEPLPGEGEDPNGNGMAPQADQGHREWREVAEQAKAVAAAAGSGMGSAIARVVDQPPPKVRWESVLRGTCARALAAHGYDDSSFKRVNRRSHSGPFILPGSIAYKATVACVIDTSSSVDEKALERAVAEVVAITRTTPEVAIYLVTHDDRVQWEGWIQGGKHDTAIKIRTALRGRGGTRFTGAYRTVEKAGKRFDAFVHLTDGMPCEEWPAKPRNVRQPIAALIGDATSAYVPTGWRVIEVEVANPTGSWR